MGGDRLLQYANYVFLQLCAKNFFKINFDFELGILRGLPLNDWQRGAIYKVLKIVNIFS